MEHIIKVEVLENLPKTRPLIAMDANWEFILLKPVPRANEIWYTSSDGNIVTPYQTSSLPEIDTNTYSNGKGIIKFKTDVTNIGNYAFENCTRLTSIEIPDSVTSIGNQTFRDCSGLTSVMIPNGVTSIEIGAFYGCNSLTSITIPDSVTSIGNRAFYSCKGLTSVTIPNSVTSIGQNTFLNCSLTSVTINSNAIVSATYTDKSNMKHIFG